MCEKDMIQTISGLEFKPYFNQLEQMFNIKDPFYIFSVRTDHSRYEQHIYIAYTSKTLFPCPCCSLPDCKVHSKAPRYWRHLDNVNYKVYLHLDVPKIHCPNCNKISTLQISWARPNCGLTLKFEQRVLAFSKIMSFSDVSRLLGETDKRMSFTVNHYVEIAREKQDLSSTTSMIMDETSKSKGHSYISPVVDKDTEKVIHISDGKDKASVKEFADELIKKGGDPNNIKEAIIDMSPAFIAGIQSQFPNAFITFDKFHVVKLVNAAVDATRREEVKTQPILRNTRYMWLKNPENLTQKQKDNLEKISKQNTKTARAYRYKLAVQSTYTINNITDAEIQWKHLISWGKRSRIDALKDFALTAQNHLVGILNYYKNKSTSGLIEGINSVIQLIKRRARGFPNTKHFKNMIYLTLGDLKIPVLYGTGEAQID